VLFRSKARTSKSFLAVHMRMEKSRKWAGPTPDTGPLSVQAAAVMLGKMAMENPEVGELIAMTIRQRHGSSSPLPLGLQVAEPSQTTQHGGSDLALGGASENLLAVAASTDGNRRRRGKHSGKAHVSSEQPALQVHAPAGFFGMYDGDQDPNSVCKTHETSPNQDQNSASKTHEASKSQELTSNLRMLQYMQLLSKQVSNPAWSAASPQQSCACLGFSSSPPSQTMRGDMPSGTPQLDSSDVPLVEVVIKGGPFADEIALMAFLRDHGVCGFEGIGVIRAGVANEWLVQFKKKDAIARCLQLNGMIVQLPTGKWPLQVTHNLQCPNQRHAVQVPERERQAHTLDLAHLIGIEEPHETDSQDLLSSKRLTDLLKSLSEGDVSAPAESGESDRLMELLKSLSKGGESAQAESGGGAHGNAEVPSAGEKSMKNRCSSDTSSPWSTCVAEAGARGSAEAASAEAAGAYEESARNRCSSDTVIPWSARVAEEGAHGSAEAAIANEESVENRCSSEAVSRRQRSKSRSSATPSGIDEHKNHPALPLTTVVLKMLPKRFGQKDLVTVLNASDFRGAFDFVYLPHDFETRAPKGYAFVNFRDAETAALFNTSQEGKPLLGRRGGVIQISIAEVQGFHANALAFVSKRQRKNMRQTHCRPMVFLDGSDHGQSLDEEMWATASQDAGLRLQ